MPELRWLVRGHVIPLRRSCHEKVFLIEMIYVVHRGVEQCRLVHKMNDEINSRACSPPSAGFDSVGRGHDFIALAHPIKRRGRYSRNMCQRVQCVSLPIRRSLHFLVNCIRINPIFAFLTLNVGSNIEEVR